jgi:mannose-6-phosphate isomerase-like protein (cupin superfamily)
LEQGTSRARIDRDPDDRFVRLRRALGVGSFGMNQIVLRAGERGRIHRHHRQEEVYLVLKGTLTLLVEGEAIELEEGELIRVAPDLRRQLVNRGPETLSVLALGGEGEHRGRDGEAFGSWDEQRGVSPQDLPLPPDLPEAERRRA